MIEDSAVSANPQLKGKTSMEVFDATVKSLTDAGVMVILNNHISDAGWCCSETDGNGMWYNPNYPEETWINILAELTERYKDNKLVVGNDLRNELRADRKHKKTPKWATGNPKNDWMMAAKKAASQVQAHNPDLLIIVEGLSYANDLTGIKENPLLLDTPNKLVYSAHAYDWELSNYTTYAETAKDYDDAFGYIVKDTSAAYHAPLWLGEFGTNSKSNYWKFTNQYIKERGLHYAYWAFNGD